MVIPTNWCLTQSVELPAQRWSEEGAACAFEPSIPVNLEALTYAATRVDRQRALVVGVFTEPLRRIVKCLKDALVFIDAVLVEGALLTEQNGLGTKAARHGIVLADCRRMVTAVVDTGKGMPTQLRTCHLSSADEEGPFRQQVLRATLVSGPPCT